MSIIQETIHMCKQDLGIHEFGFYRTRDLMTNDECFSKNWPEYENSFIFSTLHLTDNIHAAKKTHYQATLKVAKTFYSNFQDLVVISNEELPAKKSYAFSNYPFYFIDSFSLKNKQITFYNQCNTSGVHFKNGINAITYYGCILY